jgi:threonine/homoserine/homoserine lactone efflux protein
VSLSVPFFTIISVESFTTFPSPDWLLEFAHAASPMPKAAVRMIDVLFIIIGVLQFVLFFFLCNTKRRTRQWGSFSAKKRANPRVLGSALKVFGLYELISCQR